MEQTKETSNEARTLDERWRNTTKRVMEALQQEKMTQIARDKLLEHHVQRSTDTDNKKTEMEMYEDWQVYKELRDMERAIQNEHETTLLDMENMIENKDKENKRQKHK